MRESSITRILASDLNWHEFVGTLGQCPQILPPQNRADEKQNVIHHRPDGGRFGVWLAVFIQRLYAAPESRKAHAVAEGVNHEDGQQASGTEEQEGGICAE